MMTAQERKQQERSARRRSIQQAARGVFKERGFHKTSVEMVAKQAGLSVGAIYLYFRSKEDLYLSLLEDTLDGLCQELSAYAGKTDVGNRLDQVWATLTTWAVRENEGTSALRMVSQPNVQGQLSDEVTASLRIRFDKVLEVLTSCVDGRSGFSENKQVAQVIWCLFLGKLETDAGQGNLAMSQFGDASVKACLDLIQSAPGLAPGAAQQSARPASAALHAA